MKAVDHKVNIVPVIAKADTLTKQEVIRLKHKVTLQSHYFCNRVHDQDRNWALTRISTFNRADVSEEIIFRTV